MKQDQTLAVDGAKTLAAISSCYFVGFLGMNFLPMWLGVLVGRLSVSGAMAGWIGTSELAAMALASILISMYAGCINRTRAAFMAVAAVVGLNALSTTTANVGLLIGLRSLTGLGEGSLMALAAAGVAATLKPERTMSVILIILNLSMALLFLVASIAINLWGSRGLLGLMAGLAAIVAPLFRWMPRGMQATESRANVASSRLRNLRATLALASVALLLIGHGMVFAFVERIGAALGMSLQQIGSVLSASMLIDCFAPVMVIALGLQLGRVIPIGIGLSALLVATLTVTQAASSVFFALGVWLQLLAYTFVLPFLASLLASLDRQGRVAAAMSGAITVGFMLAPAVGGMLVTQSSDFRLMGWVAGSMYLLIIALLMTGLFHERTGATELIS